MLSNKISLYALSIFLFDSAIKSGSKDSFYNEILSIGDFKEDIDSGDISRRCKKLGQSGWVVCPFWEMDLDKGESILITWEEKLQDNREDDIVRYFIENNHELLKYILGRINMDLISLSGTDYRTCITWLNEAKKVFFDKYYLSCAMILTALFERLIRTHPDSKNMIPKQRNPSEIFNLTAKAEINAAKIVSNYDPILLKQNEEQVLVRFDTLSLIYEKHYLLPSLEGFIQTYYNLPGYKLETGLEPNKLVRNWLMHGLTDIKIGELECVKLFNAICTFLSIRTDLATY